TEDQAEAERRNPPRSNEPSALSLQRALPRTFPDDASPDKPPSARWVVQPRQQRAAARKYKGHWPVAHPVQANVGMVEQQPGRTSAFVSIRVLLDSPPEHCRPRPGRVVRV